MKADIHPKYHTVNIVMTDGSSFETRSSYGKEGDNIQLDVDITTHPAWNAGKNLSLKKTGQMEKFSAKFGDFAFGSKKAAASEEETDDKASA